MQSHGDSLEAFSRSTEVDSNSDLNTEALQRQPALDLQTQVVSTHCHQAADQEI